MIAADVNRHDVRFIPCSPWTIQNRWSLCRNFLFRPFEAYPDSTFDPGLTPWAALLRRCAAEQCPGW
jgi:hypothetical protein